MKIYLSPSTQRSNPYAVGNTNEKEQMEKMAWAVKSSLEEFNGVEVVMATLHMGIGSRPSEARAAGCDLYLALHSNAGSTTAEGPVALYHPDQPSMKLLGEYLCAKLALASPYGTDRKNPVYSGMEAYDGFGYGEIREPKKLGMRCLLLEVDFHSNPVTARRLIDLNAQIGHLIGRLIADYYSLTKTVIAVNPKPVYRVQAGAYRVRKNAEELVARLQADGYDAYIKEESL